MRVRLGDGRWVECQTGIRRLPPGPSPEVLASEVTVATKVDAWSGHDYDRPPARAPILLTASAPVAHRNTLPKDPDFY